MECKFANGSGLLVNCALAGLKVNQSRVCEALCKPEWKDGAEPTSVDLLPIVVIEQMNPRILASRPMQATLPADAGQASSSMPNKKPSLPSRMLAFGKAFLDWLAAGRPIVPAAEYYRRIETCKGVPDAKNPNHRTRCQWLNGESCDKCGCVLTIKMQMATTHCPLEGEDRRWDVYEGTDTTVGPEGGPGACGGCA